MRTLQGIVQFTFSLARMKGQNRAVFCRGAIHGDQKKQGEIPQIRRGT